MSSVDYTEPLWHSKPSPYYTDSHHAFRKKIRTFVDTEILPFVAKWDESGTYPPSLREKAYKAGIYGALWPKEYGGTPPDNYDAFHSLIWHDELARAGSGGLMASVFLPPGWGLLPILKHGLQSSAKSIENTVIRDVISGRKTIALAVTEPNAGSDVANIQTTAVSDPTDDKYLIVSGEKYFISNGMNADYLCCAVRTGGGKGKRGGVKSLSFILIDRQQCKGVYASKMKTQGWWLGGTAYLILRNVRVPKSCIVGQINNGFVPILSNFNHGRFAMASTACRYSRVCLKDAIAFAQKRHTFGKRLIDHQSIRHKIAEMARRVESSQAMLEQVTYLMKCGSNDRVLSGPMALIKIDAAKTMEFCAREASQIFGGRSYIRGGTAARVERIYREVCVMGIAEGATEVLSDLILKQAKL